MCGHRRSRLIILLLVTLPVAAALTALAACGSSGPAAAPGGTSTPSGTPMPQLSAPDGRSLVEACIDATDDDGFTQKVRAELSTTTAKPDDESSTETVAFDGVMELPGKWRLAVTAPMNGTMVTFEMVTVDGKTYYVRVPGMSGWQIFPPGEGPPGDMDYVRSMKASLAACTSIEVSGEEEVRGARCWVVDVVTDEARLERIYEGAAFSEQAQDALGLSDGAMRTLLPTIRATSRLWIGQADHYLYRSVDENALDAGEAGSYSDHSTTDCSAFGQPIQPPITTPKSAA